jgi:hypothetical protein
VRGCWSQGWEERWRSEGRWQRGIEHKRLVVEEAAKGSDNDDDGVGDDSDEE